MSTIKFAISSHINYVESTESKLINSLLNSGVNVNDIYTFIGGYDVSSGYNKLDGETHRFSVPHNSMDFTGLISVIELDIESDFWFLIHDTCYVGGNFYNTIKNFNYENVDYVALTFDTSMNMGSYRWSYIQEKKEQILTYKNIDDNDLQSFKKRLIDEEDVFIKPKTHSYCKDNRKTEGPYDYYKNNTQRIIEYFPTIDLFKIKANWQIKPFYEIKL